MTASVLELERLQSALKLVTWRLSKSPLETPGQNNLEVIQQCDAEGHVQATHERYDIFREVRKTIGATPEEDVVTIVLEQESVIEMRLRHLESGQGIQDGAIQDLGDVVSGLAEAQGVSL